MNIGQIAVEELRATLGDGADVIGSEVYQQVREGAAIARTALGSDGLYENFLGRQARRIQEAEAAEAETERAERGRFGKFFTYDDDKPAAPVLNSKFFE